MYKYFTDEEVAGLSDELVGRLDAMRGLASQLAADAGYSRDLGMMSITSGFRDGDDGSHGDHEAVDIKIYGSRARYFLLKAAFLVGFTRIGIYDLHIHLDVSKRHDLDDHVCWWGESQ